MNETGLLNNLCVYWEGDTCAATCEECDGSPNNIDCYVAPEDTLPPPEEDDE